MAAIASLSVFALYISANGMVLLSGMSVTSIIKEEQCTLVTLCVCMYSTLHSSFLLHVLCVLNYNC